MVFIESRVFSRRLLALGKDGSAEVLSAIQSDLLDNPERGRIVQGLGGIRKARPRTPTGARASVVDSDICTCTLCQIRKFSCSICSTKTSRRISAPSSESCSANWLLKASDKE